MAQSSQEYFRLILLTVVGQAFNAAGYILEERPLQWAGGLFRFAKHLPSGLYGFIEFQLLNYTASPFTNETPSRFCVTLIRSDLPNPSMPTSHPAFSRRKLAALVTDDFRVAILPSSDHWWTFQNTLQLGRALAEAGHLIVGYGMPWLSQELLPPSG
jgi:hypothetical protein